MNFTLRKPALAFAAIFCALNSLAVVNDITLKNVTPKAGDLDIEIRSLEQITLTFSTDVNIRENTLAYLSTPDGKELTSVMQRNKFLKNTVLVEFPDINYYNGDYTLTIRRWSVGDDEWLADYEQGHSNAEIKVEWTVSNGLVAGVEYDMMPVSVLPANGSVFTYPERPLSSVQITMPAGTAKNPAIQAQLSCVEARYGNALTFEAENKGNNVVYTAVVSPAPSVDGDYTLSFPAGMFGDEEFLTMQKGHANPELHYLYTVNPSDEDSTGDEENVEYSIVPSGMEITKSENKYTLLWKLPSGIEADTEALSGCRILDSRGYRVAGVKFSPASEENPTSGITFEAELKPTDTYTLLVPEAVYYNEAYITSDKKIGKANPQIRYDFVPEDATTGIGAAVSEPEAKSNTVYTTQGVKLYDNATESQLRALAPGLYIIAGKKVIVR